MVYLIALKGAIFLDAMWISLRCPRRTLQT